MNIVKYTFIAMLTTLVMSCDQKKDTYSAATIADDTNNVNQANNLLEENNNLKGDESGESAVFTLDQEEYNLGDVQAGSKTKKIIEFTNTGSSPLLIQSAKASCGCTVPQYSKEPVAPGEKGKLTVEYTAPNINGVQNKTVTLNTNTAKSVETFRIKANVIGGDDRPAPKTQPQQAPQNLPAPDLGSIN